MCRAQVLRFLTDKNFRKLPFAHLIDSSVSEFKKQKQVLFKKKQYRTP